MDNPINVELTDKMKDLKLIWEKANSLKWDICLRLVKQQCPDCPLIAVCDQWDEFYGKSVLV